MFLYRKDGLAGLSRVKRTVRHGLAGLSRVKRTVWLRLGPNCHVWQGIPGQTRQSGPNRERAMHLIRYSPPKPSSKIWFGRIFPTKPHGCPLGRCKWHVATCGKNRENIGKHSLFRNDDRVQVFFDCKLRAHSQHFGISSRP